MKTATPETRQKLFDKLKEKSAAISVYDNGGNTVDRYTIYFDISGTEFTAEKFVVVASDSPSDPQGIWVHEAPRNSMLEDQTQRITLLDLPEAVAQKIIEELDQ